MVTVWFFNISIQLPDLECCIPFILISGNRLLVLSDLYETTHVSDYCGDL